MRPTTQCRLFQDTIWCPDHKLMKGMRVAIHRAHGYSTFYPLATIEIDISGADVKVKADTLPVLHLLGLDIQCVSCTPQMR